MIYKTFRFALLCAFALASVSGLAAPIPAPLTTAAQNRYLYNTKAVTTAANGGGTAAAVTITFTGERIQLHTCNDTDGCTATMAETNAFQGAELTIINVSANAIAFADSSGVIETTGGAAYSMAQYQGLHLRYLSDRWSEIARSAVPATGVPFVLENGESVSAATDGQFTFTRDTPGTVTVTAADDDATAALTVLPGGAAALTLGGASTTGVSVVSDTVTFDRAASGTVTLQATDDNADATIAIRGGGTGAVIVGNASNTSVTVTTDGTGDGEFVLPAGAVSGTEILDGTITLPDLQLAGMAEIKICGDAVTVSANDVYYGPSPVVVAGYGQTCDITQAGNTTEATADAVAPGLAAITSAQVRAMHCLLNDPGATGVTLTLRSAAADTTPSVTCSIADNATGCVADVQTTTPIDLSQPMAVEASDDGDVGTAQFHCTIYVVF